MNRAEEDRFHLGPPCHRFARFNARSVGAMLR